MRKRTGSGSSKHYLPHSKGAQNMMKKISLAAVLCIAAVIGGCTLSVTPSADTTVRAENDLTNVSVSIGGASTAVGAVDLYGVTIGDALFPYVASGTVTSQLVTYTPGSVYVEADSAVASDGMYLFTGIARSTATLSSGILNTVSLGSSFIDNSTVKVRAKVKVENDLTHLSVNLGGFTTAVDAIDLVGITVGDLYFPSVNGGSISSSQITGTTGTVTITIDSVYVMVPVLAVETYQGFAYTGAMTATITPGIINTITFDASTAAAIIQSLAKRKAQ
jgi:hypothetical protein